MEPSNAALSTDASSASASVPPTERELRRLLTSRRPEDATRLQDWLDHPPPDAPDAVISLIAHIAADSKLGSPVRKLLVTLPLFLIIYGGCYFLSTSLGNYLGNNSRSSNIGVLVLPQQLLLLLGIFFYTSSKWRASNAATLLLARTDNPRGVQCLANLWTPLPLTRRATAFNEMVNQKLTRLLSERQGNRFDVTTEESLRRLVQRALPTSSKAWIQQRFRPTPDLSEAEANLLLSVVRHLSHTQAKKAGSFPQADEATLQRVATSPALGEHSHLLRDTAQTLLQQRAGRQAP